MTSEQMRAARAILRWSAKDLAQRAGVALTTIQRSELASGEVPMMPANAKAVQQVLEDAGIEFSENGIRWSAVTRV